MPIITLLTDFGTVDEYAGLMKGVILSVNPSASIVDITHKIDPQDILQAAYLIKSSYRYFPEGTIHVVVIDPGVGSKRSIISFERSGHFFLAPDNGVLSLLLDQNDTRPIIRINRSEYFRQPVSMTFHGRDIMAPVAGHMSTGVRINDLGTVVGLKDVTMLNFPRPKILSSGELTGQIVSIDRFGNLITNIDSDLVHNLLDMSPGDGKRPGDRMLTRVGDEEIKGLSLNYSSAKQHEPLVCIGSRGTLEIAVNCGNASRELHAGKGTSVRLSLSG